MCLNQGANITKRFESAQFIFTLNKDKHFKKGRIGLYLVKTTSFLTILCSLYNIAYITTIICYRSAYEMPNWFLI